MGPRRDLYLTVLALELVVGAAVAGYWGMALEPGGMWAFSAGGGRIGYVTPAGLLLLGTVLGLLLMGRRCFGTRPAAPGRGHRFALLAVVALVGAGTVGTAVPTTVPAVEPGVGPDQALGSPLAG